MLHVTRLACNGPRSTKFFRELSTAFEYLSFLFTNQVFFYIKSLRGLIPPIRRLCQLVTTFGRRQLRWGLFPRDGSVERPRVWEQVLRVFRHTHMQWTDSSNRIYAATGLHSLSVSNTLQYS